MMNYEWKMKNEKLKIKNEELRIMNEGKNSLGNFWSLLVFYYFFAVLMVECSFFYAVNYWKEVKM